MSKLKKKLILLLILLMAVLSAVLAYNTVSNAASVIDVPTSFQVVSRVRRSFVFSGY